MTPMDEYDDITPKRAILAKPLNTRGLMLLPLYPGGEDYSHWLNDPEVVKYSELRHRKHTYESCQEYIKGFDQIDRCIWSIHVIGANCYIGNITIEIDRNNGVGQMGMLIGEKWAWGRKFGQEAWMAVILWAKENLIRRVEAGCMGGNQGMRLVATKTGMELTADIGAHFVRDGKPETKLIYRRNLGNV